jgi:heterodisulfide reductase subunit A
MAAARASLLDPISDIAVPVNKSALVVGGGVAGMTAALNLAEQGFPATLVEKDTELGGVARDVGKTWKGEDVQAFLDDLINRVQQHPDIDVMTGTEITEASGFVGNFETTLRTGGNLKTVQHGATVVATGGRASETDEYLFGKNERVMRWHDLEHNLEKIKDDDTVVFIQCVGSRNEERPYCSRICCTNSIVQAIAVKEQHPDAGVYILYRDIRTFGERELLYKKARELGVVFIRYTLDKKPVVAESGDGLIVTIFDPILQREIAISADWLNLTTAIVPADNEKLAGMYKLPLNAENFFMEAHAKLRPVEFASDGVYLCGLAHYPKSIDESIAQAMAAASRAATVLSKDAIKVSPLVSQVDQEKCIGCGLCTEVCAFSAIVLEEVDGRKRAKNIPASCKGCGLCASSCPQHAIDMLHYKHQQILAAVCAAA